MLQALVFGILFFTPQQKLSPNTQSKQEYLVRHYTIENGLPVNSVNGIAQDDDGYLYISTHDGLVQYDGYTFKVFNSANSTGLNTNRILGVIKSQSNDIWMYNEGGKVSIKSDGFIKTFSAPEIPGIAFRLIEGSDGRIWVSGSEGLAYYNETDTTFTTLKHPLFEGPISLINNGLNGKIFGINSSGLVAWQDGKAELILDSKDYPTFNSLYFTNIKQFEEGIIWIVGGNNILKIDTENQQLEYIKVPQDKPIMFWNIHAKSPDKFLLSSSVGYYELNSQTLGLTKLPIEVNSQIFRTNIVYEGSNGEDVFIGDNEVIIDGKKVLSAPSLKAGFLDKEGSLWVLSESNGLYQIRKSSFKNFSTPEFPGVTNIYSIIEDSDGTIWACGIDEGIVKFSDLETVNYRTTSTGINMRRCKFLYEDIDGTLYAGIVSSEGIWKYKNEQWVTDSHFSSAFKNLNIASEAMHRKGDQLLVGTQNSLFVKENEEVRLYDASNPKELQGIQAFAEDSRGIIYAATSAQGVTRIEGNSYTNYSKEDGYLNSNIVRDVFLQSDDTLWIATENLGLNRLILNKEGKVSSSSSITPKEGLIHNSLHNIIDDSLGNVWITSNGGLMKISKAKLNDFADGKISTLPLLSYNENDGMINREFNGGVHSSGILASDGTLWLPSQQGITTIKPADVANQQSIFTPRPIFTSLQLAEQEIYLGDKSTISLPLGKRDVRVNFTAPNFANQDKVNFSYILEGINSNWQTVNRSKQAVFTGIPAGKYTLYIRAENFGGEPKETSLLIDVPYYFYETGWFIVLLFVGVVVLIAGLFRLRLKNLKQSEENLKRRVRVQTKELEEAAEQKSRFFIGITHELKTPLSLIIGPLEDISHQIDDNNPLLLQNRIDMMKRNGYRLQNLIDQILDVSKLNADAIKLNVQPTNLAALTKKVIGQFQSKLEQEQVHCSIDFNDLETPIYIDVEAWEHIIINLMDNAIKFSPKDGFITLTLKNLNDSVELLIKDNGPGIDPQYHSKVFNYLYQVSGKKAAQGTGIGLFLVTGIGLFLVKGLVEEMGGTIELLPNNKEGAEFKISLKKGYTHLSATHSVNHSVVFIDNIATDSNIASNSTDIEPLEDLSDQQILIVEDNVDFRNYLSSILQSKYSVITAENGQEALKILKKEVPTLVISDVMMPEMNGLEFVNEVRKKSTFKHLPVIFLSAKNMDLDIEQGLSTGADIYLTKPIRSRVLLAQIDAVLRREMILKNYEYRAPANSDESELITQVRKIVYRQLANTALTASLIADSMYISRAKLYYDWNKVSDISINDFIKQLRLEEGKALIEDHNFSVKEAARAVGFSNSSYFSTSFKKRFNVSPSKI